MGYLIKNVLRQFLIATCTCGNAIQHKTSTNSNCVKPKMTTIPTYFCTVFAKIHQNCLKGSSIHIWQLLYPLNHPVHRTGHTPSMQFAVPWLCGLSTSVKSSYSYFKNTNMVRKKTTKDQFFVLELEGNQLPCFQKKL